MTVVIKVVRHASPAEMLDLVGEHLLADEAMNNHMFGVIGDAIAGGYSKGENSWLSALEGDEVVGCAFRTFPWPMGLSFGSSPAAAAALVSAADAIYADAFGFNISPHLRAAVASAVDSDLEEVVGQGVYRLETVRMPTGIAGRLRRASEWDVDVVTQWTLAFQDEVHDGIRREEHELRKLVRHWVDRKCVAIWDVDGVPASMASARGPTPNGIRISLVYTPLEHRQNGYASACVAALSQKQLDDGRAFCFLFTDLSNPTSNHIYRSIGYERVGDLTRLRRV